MSDFICKKCGSSEYEIKDKLNGTGVAHGLYCAKCGFWHKWLGKEELRKMSIIKPQEKCYSLDEVNHLIAEEDKLIQKLKSENAELRERLDKTADVIDEFMERLKELLTKHEHRSQTDGVPFYQINAESFCDELDELADEMRQEVEK